MKTFEEVVNDITREGYCIGLPEEELRTIFESLSPEQRWKGTYHGWDTWGFWQEVCKEVHKYMQAREESY